MDETRKIINFYTFLFLSIRNSYGTKSGHHRDASLISRILGRERSRQQSEIFNERRATCFGTRETFYSARNKNPCPTKKKLLDRLFVGAVPRMIDILQISVTWSALGVAVHESRTRILIVLAKGAREEELHAERERDGERRPTGLSTRTHVVRACVCMRTYTISRDVISKG